MSHSYTWNWKMEFNVEVIQAFRIQYSDWLMKRNTLNVKFLGMYSVNEYILKVSFQTVFVYIVTTISLTLFLV